MSLSTLVTLGKFPRIFLTILAVANLSLGVLFYSISGAMIAFWAWPVKELAVRFLGAIFIAISLGCYSALTARLWQRAKILVLVGGSFFGLTGIVSAFQAVTVSNGTAIWIWTAYFLGSGTGLILLIKKYGWRRKQSENPGRMVARIPTGIFFGIQTSVVGIFGAMMVLLPAVAQTQFWPWKVAPPTLQTFGALFLATCLATGWAFFQKDPARILVLLPLDATFPTLALAAVGIGWSTIVAESPSWLVTGVWLFLYSFVSVGSTALFVTMRRLSRVPQ